MLGSYNKPSGSCIIAVKVGCFRGQTKRNEAFFYVKKTHLKDFHLFVKNESDVITLNIKDFTERERRGGGGEVHVCRSLYV